jgi:hypothetical protein
MKEKKVTACVRTEASMQQLSSYGTSCGADPSTSLPYLSTHRDYFEGPLFFCPDQSPNKGDLNAFHEARRTHSALSYLKLSASHLHPLLPSHFSSPDSLCVYYFPQISALCVK